MTVKTLALDTITQQVVLLTAEVGAFMKGEINKVSIQDISAKEKNSLVSYVDQQCEQMLVSGLKKICPDAGFLTEEGTTAQITHGLRWIIDPLDGTTNYLHKLPIYAISVALYMEEEGLIGVVREVAHDECFSAWKGGGAYLNEVPLSQVPELQLQDTLVGTGFPYNKAYDQDAYLNLMGYWLNHTRGIRRMGSAAVDLCFVAAGRFGLYYECHLNPWDVAAGAIIVRESGAKVTGGPDGGEPVSSDFILAAHPALYEVASKQIVHFLFDAQ